MHCVQTWIMMICNYVINACIHYAVPHLLVDKANLWYVVLIVALHSIRALAYIIFLIVFNLLLLFIRSPGSVGSHI